MSQQSVIIPNGAAVNLADIPCGPLSGLHRVILERVAGGSHLAAFFMFRTPAGERRLTAVLTSPEEHGLAVGMSPVAEDAIPSLTPECPEAHMFEREIREAWGVTPRGHPWLKPVRYPSPDAAPGVTDFFRVDGEQVHEVAVGPVHAGVIEPGHFRFQCHGEEVMHLEIALGFQHRGIEAKMAGGPGPLTRHYMETAAGDTTIGHATAYAMAVEALAGLEVAEPAARVRAVALELERIANHVGDLGALSGDVGFLPTASYCGRLRGDILNLTALVCGNRFGRGLVLPGGVRHGIGTALAGTMAERLETALRDIQGALALLFRRPSVLARFEDTGIVDRLTADHLGLVGPAARASGLEVDVRCDLPYGAYKDAACPLEIGERGDVLARAKQRRNEVEASAQHIRHWLGQDCDAPARTPREAAAALRPEQFAVALVEGWRGQICHAAVTDGSGKFAAYKVVDPSFHNWTGLAMSLRGQQVSDFPLCNKSFNLSYCGHDL